MSAIVRGAALLELAQLDDPHVLGVGLGLGLDRGRVALGLLADLGGVGGGFLDDVGGLLLGQAQHLAGLAAEPGVGRVLVLVDLVAQATRPRRSSALRPAWASVRLAVRPAFSAVSVRRCLSTAAVS